jgi:hypothetical protein
MYKNKARMEHGKEDSGDFDMGSVVIPSLARKQHAVSKNYRSEVSDPGDCFLFSLTCNTAWI